MSSAPLDHAEILDRWEAFNLARTATAFGAFVPLILLVLLRAERDPRRQ